MKKHEFINLIVDELEIENTEVSEDTLFSSLEEWDSMGKMVMISLISEKFNIALTNDDINALTNISSLISKIGTERFN